MGKTDQGKSKQPSPGRREFGRGPADPAEGMPSELGSGGRGKSDPRQQAGTRPEDDDDDDDEELDQGAEEDLDEEDEDEGDIDEDEDEEFEGADPKRGPGGSGRQ